MLAAVKRRFSNRRTSIIGWRARSSATTKAPSSTSAAANEPRIEPLVQPCDGASIRP
jgi:hypothetical protein